ncbi:MAG TPA: hypothetical protein VI564_03645 [Candidatus Nanoarchaeia archaeon]|nr:hypothetical protein [Candidatus Nanoarchaeia archaeon]
MKKLEEDYNWKVILSVSVPVSIIVGYLNYSSLSDTLKLWSVIIGSLVSAWIVYFISKKKSNIFTAAAIVFLVAIVIKFLKSSSLI